MTSKRRDPSPLDFIIENPVFRLEELQAEYLRIGRAAESAVDLVEYHLQQGRIQRVRRGVYSHARFVDPWVVASKLASTVVVSHDGALSFHGLTGVGHSLSFMTTDRTSIARFNDIVYQPLRVTELRLSQSKSQQHEREGQRFRVTTLEASLVDCLSLLARSPEPVALMELFEEARGRADPRAMIKHALHFKSPLLNSRLGFFLMCAHFDVTRGDLAELESAAAPASTPFQRGVTKKNDGYAPKWRLVVPAELFAFWRRL
jgi:predicted transcriptional regulator of viral defense system